MYHLRIEIPGLPRLQSGAFGHWRERRKHDSRWKQLVGYELRGKFPPKPFERAFVVCTRFSASSKAPDRDNLVASFKPLVDALVDPPLARPVLVDDSPDHMTAEYHWEPCPRGKGRVVIEVAEVGGE